MSWDPSIDNAGVGSYLVYRNGAYIGFTAGDVTLYVDTPPTQGVANFYEVRAVDVNDNRSGLSDPGATVTVGGEDTEPPSVPSNVAATDVGDGDGSVQLSWDASTDNVAVSSYLIYRDGSYLAWTGAAVTTFVDNLPAEGVAYLYEVRAVDVNDNRSDKSDPGATITIGGLDIEAPTAPSNVVAVDVGDGSIALSWDASIDNVGVGSYLIYRDGAYIGFTTGDRTTFAEVPPAEGVAYLYEVRAVDTSDNRSDKSDPGATVTVGGLDIEAPTAPSNVVAVDVGDGSIALSWDASVDNVAISSYLVYRDGAYVAWTQSGVTTFAEVPPAAGVVYLYEVRAVDVNDNRSGLSDPGASASVGGVDVEAPSVPSNLVAVDVGDGSVLVSWDVSVDNVGISSYLVYRDGAYVAWTTSDVTTFSETPPSEGVEYTYAVRAVDINNNRSELTDPGASVTIGGPDLEAPSVPLNVGLISPAAGSTEIIWDPSVDNVGISSYLVYRDGAYLAWTPGDTTTFIDLTSVAGETYDYEIRAVDTNDNRSDKSTPFTVAIQ